MKVYWSMQISVKKSNIQNNFILQNGITSKKVNIFVFLFRIPAERICFHVSIIILISAQKNKTAIKLRINLNQFIGLP